MHGSRRTASDSRVPVGRLTILSLGASALDRTASFVLIAIVAAVFGASTTSDTYFLAITIPLVVGGALTEALYLSALPLYYRAERDRANLARIARWTWAGTTAATLVYAAVIVIAAPDDLGLWLVVTPVLFAQSIAGLLAARLVARRKYTIATMRAALASGLALLITAGALLVHRSIYIVAVALTIGNLVMLALLAAAGRHTGSRQGRAQDDKPLLLLTGAAAAVGAVLLVGPMGLVLERFLASSLPEGTVSMLAYARGIALVPLMVVFAIANGVFAFSAERASVSSYAEVRDMTVVALRVVLSCAVAATVYLVLWHRSLVGVAVERGKLSGQTASDVGSLVAIFGLGVVGMAMLVLVTRMELAAGRRKEVGLLGLSALCAYVALALVLRREWGGQGLAAAYAICMSVVGAVAASLVVARLRIGLKAALRELVAVPSLLGLLFALGAELAAAVTDPDQGFGSSLVIVVLALIGGSSAFVAGTWVIGGPEWAYFSATWQRLRGRARAWSSRHAMSRIE